MFNATKKKKKALFYNNKLIKIIYLINLAFAFLFMTLIKALIIFIIFPRIINII